MHTFIGLYAHSNYITITFNSIIIISSVIITVKMSIKESCYWITRERHVALFQWDWGRGLYHLSCCECQVVTATKGLFVFGLNLPVGFELLCWRSPYVHRLRDAIKNFTHPSRCNQRGPMVSPHQHYCHKGHLRNVFNFHSVDTDVKRRIHPPPPPLIFLLLLKKTSQRSPPVISNYS